MAHADVNMASEEKRTDPIIAVLINGTEIVKGIKQVWKQKIQNIITSINVEITQSILEHFEASLKLWFYILCYRFFERQ